MCLFPVEGIKTKSIQFPNSFAFIVQAAQILPRRLRSAQELSVVLKQASQLTHARARAASLCRHSWVVSSVLPTPLLHTYTNTQETTFYVLIDFYLLKKTYIFKFNLISTSLDIFYSSKKIGVPVLFCAAINLF